MNRLKVTIRDRENAEVTVTSEVAGIAMKIVMNLEETQDLISKLVAACEWMEKKQRHSSFKYQPLEEEENGD